MLKRILRNKKRIFLIGLAFLGLILIRVFEDNLFYDPFLSFYKSEYLNKPLPVFNGVLLFVNLFFRYFVNTLFSLSIIWLLFFDKTIVKFSANLFVFFFVVLVLAFFGILFLSNNPDYLILFYVRRFLIQPLFLVLFIPAFYYQKISR
ncbi:exosortase F system-associated membrane protein [Flavobacterium cyclinae]|uniref:exosortase F system-associated membrane protein n=1 Tax=Flavobacterium cyclinae TaxID=2895947 RepID=UPI001E50D143|nr:exosortase F system-associated protein [Flavobacterium cyclinae]UGS21571.1 exosortase F system-associated protein [Flavobacterium cyclinae]